VTNSGTRDGRELRMVTNTSPSALNDEVDAMTMSSDVQVVDCSRFSLTAVAKLIWFTIALSRTM
jgi:hypothetical protein